MKKHRIYNRKTRKIETEISGNTSGLAFLYNSLPGKVLNPFIARHFVSKTYARYVRSRKSVSKIKSFIEQYHINVSEIRQPLGSFTSLNNFFIRELDPSARPVDRESSHLISPADSRLMIFDLSKKNILPVKGYWYSLEEFVNDRALASGYVKGWCFVYRLAPCDYHRFCYIDNGRQEDVRRIKGVLHSVNPIALSSVSALMAKNYRELTIMHTANFDTVLHFEVGALMVGKVMLNKRQASSFIKGEEKGWFEFGGSTVVQLFKKDAVVPDEDILEQSAKGVETLVKMGEKVGNK